MQPDFSIIMPAYNQGRYIGAAIDSVVRQTWDNWELLVIDDGSTDHTAEVVQGYHDPRLRYFYQPNGERGPARNAGLAQARGRLVSFLDADDFWHPTYLEKQLAALRANPQWGLCATWVYDTDSDGVVVHARACGPRPGQDRNSFLADMLLGNRMPIHCVTAHLDEVRAVGGFDPDLRQAEDWDLWLRLLARRPAGVITEPLVYYRHYNAFQPERQRARGVDQALLHILDKAFRALAGAPQAALRPAAFARACWRLSWISYALNDLPAGQNWLTRARDYSPAFFEPPHAAWIEACAYLADELYDLHTPPEAAIAALGRLVDGLPPWAHHLRRLRRVVLGQYWGLYLFRSYARRDWAAVRAAAWRAASANPAWLRNRGFVAIAARSVVRPLWAPRADQNGSPVHA